ncbi:MAG: F0F1 ATP synthase subunit delta [Gammaproteobacteria bacterium]
MADRTTIARPYARAAFAEARQVNRLREWNEGLAFAAQVIADPRVEKLLGSPHITPAELAKLVTDIAGRRLDERGRNFVCTLAENRRLGYLPEIARLFAELKDAAEGVVDVTVVSAAPLDAEQRKALGGALARKLKRQVRLHAELDPSLLGGAVVRAGDLVIDGCVRARLDRMAHALAA